VDIKDSDKGWICITKTIDSIVRAGDGYLENLGESYEWRVNLPKGEEICEDDVIVLRNQSHVLGFSRIEEILSTIQKRVSNTCPDCNQAQVRERKTKVPRFTCARCHFEFHEPSTFETSEEFRVAKYEPGWVSLEPDATTNKAWRTLSQTPMSQHSIQRLDISAFQGFVQGVSSEATKPFERRTTNLNGGHRLVTVRTRVGQNEFRRRLIDSFKNKCAFTGENHSTALDAAHLYSYSKLGVHHLDGGLLLRRDIHRLFDKGLLAINPLTGIIDVHKDLSIYQEYASLHGRPIQVELNSAMKKWLYMHWEQYRGLTT